MKRYTLADIGCYADGTLGHQHCREKLAELLKGMTTVKNGSDVIVLRKIRAATMISLAGEMPDDAWDEAKALYLLNEHACNSTVYFDFHDGDLCLMATETSL